MMARNNGKSRRRLTLATLLVMGAVTALVSAPVSAQEQTPPQTPPQTPLPQEPLSEEPQDQAPKPPTETERRIQRLVPPRHLTNPHSLLDLRRRLIELDRLLSLGSLSRAESLLNDLAQHSELGRELVPRRIKLAQLKGEHAEAVRLCRAGLEETPLNPSLWRSLTASLLALDQPDTARMAVGLFIETSPNARSAAIVGVEMSQKAGQQRLAIGLIDSMRLVLGESRFMGRQKAVGLLHLGEQIAAANEISLELRGNPFNLGLLRAELMDGPYRPLEHQDFLARMIELSGQRTSRSAETLLAANLLLAGGNRVRAGELIAPLLENQAALLTVMQNAVTLSRELPVLEDGTQIQATTDYLLSVLEYLCGPGNRDPNLRRRAADFLAMVCEDALERQSFGDDSQAAVRRFSELLGLVRQVNPTSEHLYSSQIKLARYTRDVLQQPAVAARRLERMLTDLDLPIQGLALVRLTLGECYLAAGDTTRGRIVLTRLGRDPEFREAAGYAHYHLARLDLAEGNFATARDRFAVIAMDNPAATYANDALELGLAIAEEMENPSGGPAILTLYARSVYYDLTARPDDRLAALESFVAEAGARLDLEEPQHLLERAHWELAGLHVAAQRLDAALTQLDQLIRLHPDGRYPAAALALRARLLETGGRLSEARESWDQLLAQYPDYLFIDDVRDHVRSLP